MLSEVVLHTTVRAQVAVAAGPCPKAPGNAQTYVNEITGWVQWGVLTTFVIGVLVSIGSIAAGKIFNMPHASKGGVVGVVVVMGCAIGYMVAPGMVKSITGC